MTDAKVEREFQTASKWKGEAQLLRSILLSCELIETFKWGKPCYMHDDRNICIIQRFTDHLALMFFKGALITDERGLLQDQGPNSRSAKRLEFTSASGIEENEAEIKAYVRLAIEIENKGLKAAPREELVLSDELLSAFDDEAALRIAFEALTPGRQREYNLHFSGAKQSATRSSRIQKYREKILSGKGMRD